MLLLNPLFLLAVFAAIVIGGEVVRSVGKRRVAQTGFRL